MNFLEQIASPKTRIPLFVGESMRSWYRWPTRLALDAPLVGVVWQQGLGIAYHRPIAAMVSGVLALSIWGIYLLDRWNDTRSTRTDTQTDRHTFARNYPRFFLTAGMLALLTAATLAFCFLPISLLITGLTLLGWVSIYGGFVHHWQPRWFVEGGGKEISVGILFAIGVALPLLDFDSLASVNPLPAVIGFASIAAINCLLIADWETGPCRLRRRQMWVCSILALWMSLLTPLWVSFSFWGSLIALDQIDRRKTKLNPELRRTLVDLALLTPLLSGGIG